MNIQTFKIFCDLVETKSFSKAADLNSVSQSAVSQQIRNVEKTYKVILVERGKGSLNLTPEGKIFHSYCRQILSVFKEMEDSLDNYSDTIAGEIKVSTVYSVGLHELPSYLKIYFKKCPKVKVSLKYSRTNKIYNDVIANIIDMGIVAFPKEHSSLDIIPFKKDRLVLVCHPENPLAKIDKIDNLNILQDINFCGFEKDIPTRKHIDNIFSYYDIKVNMKMDFDNIETIKRMVEVDDTLVTILPDSTILRELEMGTLASVSIMDDQFLRPIGIILKKGKKLSKGAKNFIELLKNYDPKNNTLLEPCCQHHEEDEDEIEIFD
ncbi:LysR family transcriptional regulator [bacterium]|nr:LysR family transcriptional regulator [bacterium]